MPIAILISHHSQALAKSETQRFGKADLPIIGSSESSGIAMGIFMHTAHSCSADGANLRALFIKDAVATALELLRARLHAKIVTVKGLMSMHAWLMQLG